MNLEIIRARRRGSEEVITAGRGEARWARRADKMV